MSFVIRDRDRASGTAMNMATCRLQDKPDKPNKPILDRFSLGLCQVSVRFAQKCCLPTAESSCWPSAGEVSPLVLGSLAAFFKLTQQVPEVK